MKIDNISLNKLRNDEHFQLMSEMRDAIFRFDPEILKIEEQFGVFLNLYVQEDEVLKKILKSAITPDILAADKYRDKIFRGLVDANKAALNHFLPNVKEAAQHVKIVLDTYGNLAQKPLNEQTSGVYNIVQDLKGAYAAHAGTAGLTDWVLELETANNAFGALMKDRYDESAAKTDLSLKQVRPQVDAAFKTIAERINALVVVEGAATYGEFIRYINTVIARYKSTVKQRTGKK
jgi:hypothetical protein